MAVTLRSRCDIRNRTAPVAVGHAGHPGQPVTRLELFYDLTVVFALLNVTALVSRHVNARGLLAGVAVARRAFHPGGVGTRAGCVRRNAPPSRR